jgi:hypothetical protein
LIFQGFRLHVLPRSESWGISALRAWLGCGDEGWQAVRRGLHSHAGARGGGHPLGHRETVLPAEHLFQEIGRPGRGIRPDFLLLLPQHIEQAIEAFAHDVTIEVKG